MKKDELLDVSEIDIVYRTKIKASKRPAVTSSEESVNILRLVWDDSLEYVECFYVMLLNRANKVLGVKKISQGGVSGTVADPKCIFQAALKANASSVILAHNHPSGNTEPSGADISLTKKMKEAGEFLDLPVLDHVILTDESYYSFADEGTL
jgi:DNA repair protein RadC